MSEERLREGLQEAIELLDLLGIPERQMKRLKRYLEPDHTGDHVNVAAGVAAAALVKAAMYSQSTIAKLKAKELPPEVLDAGMPPIDASALIRAVVNTPTKLKGKPATPPPPPPKKYI